MRSEDSAADDTDRARQSNTEQEDHTMHQDNPPGDRPNGIPYIDTENTRFGAWESGDFNIRLAREDGESLAVNLTPKQAELLAKGINRTREEAQED